VIVGILFAWSVAMAPSYKHAADRDQRLDRAFANSEKGDLVQLLREWTSAKLHDKITLDIRINRH
jgi:hypothetical protein